MTGAVAFDRSDKLDQLCCMITPFADNIWITNGPTVHVAGFHYPTRMAVIRLATGGLFIWSPVALTDTLRAEIDALGTVAHIVAPNTLHHVFLSDWCRAYPQAKCHGPAKLHKNRRDISFDTDLSDAVETGWHDDIAQIPLTGNLITTEVVFFHRTSGTVLFTDFLQQIPSELLTGWRAYVARIDKTTGAEPQVPLKFRLAWCNRRAARNAVSTILNWPVERVLMAHGTPVIQDAPAFIRRAFRWLIA